MCGEKFLHLVVVAHEMEIELRADVLKEQAGLQSDAAFMEVGSQTTNPCAGMQTGATPVAANGFDGGTDFTAFGFGKLPQLREEIRIDLNRQGWLRGRLRISRRGLCGGRFALWHGVGWRLSEVRWA